MRLGEEKLKNKIDYISCYQTLQNMELYPTIIEDCVFFGLLWKFTHRFFLLFFCSKVADVSKYSSSHGSSRDCEAG